MFGNTGPVFLAIFAPMDILVIVVVGLLLFGGKKIPELAKGLGEGIKNFKTSVKDEDAQQKDTTNKKV